MSISLNLVLGSAGSCRGCIRDIQQLFYTQSALLGFAGTAVLVPTSVVLLCSCVFQVSGML